MDPIPRLHKRTVDERANAADRDSKLAKLEAAQRQIGEKVVAELRATLNLKTAAADFDGVVLILLLKIQKPRYFIQKIRRKAETSQNIIHHFVVNRHRLEICSTCSEWNNRVKIGRSILVSLTCP